MLDSSDPLGQRQSFHSVLAWEVTLDPSHSLPCSRCKPSLQGCSHTHTQRKPFFFTHSASTRGETQYENTAPFHAFTPLSLSLSPSFVQIILSGVIHSKLPVGAVAATRSNQLFLFSISPPLKDILAKKETSVFKPVGRVEKKNLSEVVQ